MPSSSLQPAPWRGAAARRPWSAPARHRAHWIQATHEAMTAKDSDGLSASQLAQLSLIYMKIADCDDHDDGENVGMAVNAYERAMAMSPDSALLYYSSVCYDDTRHVKMLFSVVRGLELPDSCLTDEPQTDELPTD